MRARPAQITLVILLVVSSVVVVGVRTDPSEPVIQVVPKISTGAPGETFTVNITIADVTTENSINGVYAWQFGMRFNPDVLNVISTMEGPWLMSGGETLPFFKIDNDEGVVAHFSQLPWTTETGVFGSGTLANVTFQILAIGNCSLYFERDTRYTFIKSFNGTGQPPPKIPHTLLDGFFSNVHDVAITSVTPLATQVNVGDPVDIDVIVANEGDFNETFDVTTYWNIGSSEWSGVINETKTGIYLKNGTNTSPALTFTWDTTDFWAGNYTISAEASEVVNETNTSNNKYVDGRVAVGDPIATFTYSPKIPFVNEIVTFNSTSYDPNATVVSWKWDLDGDGIFDAFDENVTHTYTAAGTYTAILFVTDDEGNEAFSYESIKVVAPPVADFTYSPEEVLVRQPVDFTSTSYDADGNVESWKWDLDGDGTFDAFGENVTYTYTEARTYTVNLTVTDDDDLSDSISKNVEIKTKHDVAVESVSTDFTTFYAGRAVTIDIDVLNNGTETETFLVTTYYDNTSIRTLEVADLAPVDQSPNNKKHIEINWLTTGVPAGEYNVTAEVILGADQDPINNRATATIRVTVVDVAVANVEVSPTTVLVDNLFNVTVLVENKGTSSATPLITVEITNATSTPIELDSKADVTIKNATEKTVLFKNLNATKKNISPGVYTLSVKVKLGGEPVAVQDDNLFTYGEITLGASLVSISATPESIALGSSTTINGSITPLRRNVNVTIHHRVSGNDTWGILEIVTTDDNGTYSYDWKPEATGTYEVMVGWEGDDKALPSESETITITVNPATPILLYALAAVAVAAIIIVVAIYFLKIRKPKSA